ncbi:MAG: Rpn family recombination-promoting nuclease/putative transposase [Myxococcales bacterium]|nr:Rpn family recombination-promoting nuclease/putative transposase [Myxococcales bacterium]
MGSDTQPHDAFFKEVFRRPALAADLLRRVLPPELAAAIDFDGLEPVPAELIDDELRRNQADLLFRAHLHGREVLIFFLLEHQSRPDPMMAWRLLIYMVRIWQRWICAYLDEHEAVPKFLPPILPVVVHNGPQPWTRRRRFSDLIRLDPELLEPVRAFLPEMHLLIDDLAVAPDAQLEVPTASALATVALLCLKHAPYAQPIEPHLARWVGHLQRLAEQPGGRDALTLALRYVVEVNESVELSKLGEVLEPQFGSVSKELVMTDGQRLREEGRIEGRVEGRAEGERALLLKQIKLRFCEVPPRYAAQVAAGDVADVERWAERILTVDRLEDIFAP